MESVNLILTVYVGELTWLTLGHHWLLSLYYLCHYYIDYIHSMLHKKTSLSFNDCFKFLVYSITWTKYICINSSITCVCWLAQSWQRVGGKTLSPNDSILKQVSSTNLEIYSISITLILLLQSRSYIKYISSPFLAIVMSCGYPLMQIRLDVWRNFIPVWCYHSKDSTGT